jgi:hypothetical protein
MQGKKFTSLSKLRKAKVQHSPLEIMVLVTGKDPTFSNIAIEFLSGVRDCGVVGGGGGVGGTTRKKSRAVLAIGLLLAMASKTIKEKPL